MRLYSLVAVASLLSASVAARADSYTVNSTTGPFTASSNQPTQSSSLSFTDFNASLGTLNSISFLLTGQYQLSNGQNSYNGVSFNVSTRPNSGYELVGGFKQHPPTNGTYSVSESGQVTAQFLLNDYTGSGNGVAYVNYGTDTGTISNATPAGLNLAVTYNYAAAPPVAVTPEPSSLALLGTGLLGALGVVRNRFAR